MALSRGTSPEIIAQIKTAFARAQAERVIDRALNKYLEGIE
jgi:glutamyl-tRNA reductase